MKRCPQCEFIYEDDQSLCDMDGVLLVLDSRNLPNTHALAPISARKAQKRNRTVPAFATLILVLVLGTVYFVTTQRSNGTIPPVSTTGTTDSAPNLDKPIEPAEVNQLPAATENPSPESEDETKPATTKPPTVAPTRKATTAKTTSTTKSKISTEQKKDENKVGSILKKTGKILKKPFKF